MRKNKVKNMKTIKSYEEYINLNVDIDDEFIDMVKIILSKEDSDADPIEVVRFLLDGAIENDVSMMTYDESDLEEMVKDYIKGVWRIRK